jgi:hypothetical protein
MTTLADYCGLANYDTHTVIDENTPADLSCRMNLYSSK